MPPKKPKSSGNEVPEWILTYGDLMSLLLCFFILLAAFSEIKQPREYQMIIESIKGVIHGPADLQEDLQQPHHRVTLPMGALIQ